MLLFFPCSCLYTNKCTQYQVPNKKMSPTRINQHVVLFHPTENIWLDQNIDYWLDHQSSVSSLSFKLVNYLNFSIESCLELCNALLEPLTCVVCKYQPWQILKNMHVLYSVFFYVIFI